MVKTLITGANGFFGSHLADYLLQSGHQVCAAVHNNSENLQGYPEKLTIRQCDVTDTKEIETLILDTQPEFIFHFAAQSRQTVSWREPQTTFTINVFGTQNVLEAVRNTGISPTVVVAGSSAAYGSRKNYGSLVNETEPLQPVSPYGVSKAAAEMLARIYWNTYDLKVICIRPFFVTGTRKIGDVAADFSRGIVAVERGEDPSLSVGNVDAVRDFLDSEDGVKAVWLIAQVGVPGEVYNICSGVGHSVSQILEILLAQSKVPIPIVRDPNRLRPADEPVVVGDNSKLCALGWKPIVPIARTLTNTLDYWRRQV